MRGEARATRTVSPWPEARAEERHGTRRGTGRGEARAEERHGPRRGKGRGEAWDEERQGTRRRRCGGKPRKCAFPRCVPELAERAHVCGARHVRRVRLLRVRAGFCACGWAFARAGGLCARALRLTAFPRGACAQ